jgi:hypothetical protein
MKRRYLIIEVRQNGERRLLTRALTARDAFRIKLDLSKRFADSYFELEIYKVTLAGKERHFETPQPRFDSETRWVG